jgi:hypothetical protein
VLWIETYNAHRLDNRILNKAFPAIDRGQTKKDLAIINEIFRMLSRVIIFIAQTAFIILNTLIVTNISFRIYQTQENFT